MNERDHDAPGSGLAPDQELLDVSRRIRAALLADEPAMLEGRVAEDWRGCDPRGRPVDRAGFRGLFVAGGGRLDAFAVGEVRVDVHGDAGVVTGRGTVRGGDPGPPFERDVRFVDVFVRREQGWVLVLTHHTEVEEP